MNQADDMTGQEGDEDEVGLDKARDGHVFEAGYAENEADSTRFENGLHRKLSNNDVQDSRLVGHAAISSNHQSIESLSGSPQTETSHSEVWSSLRARRRAISECGVLTVSVEDEEDIVIETCCGPVSPLATIHEGAQGIQEMSWHLLRLGKDTEMDAEEAE